MRYMKVDIREGHIQEDAHKWNNVHKNVEPDQSSVIEREELLHEPLMNEDPVDAGYHELHGKCEFNQEQSQ